jgi:Fe2+ or Zn2+ uptake regulation protein
METFDTLTEAMQALRKQGYVEDFNLKDNYLECQNKTHPVLHDEFQIDHFYRFEGMTDPGDETILYAISSPIHNLKGVLVNAYGIYSDTVADELANKLNVLPATGN